MLAYRHAFHAGNHADVLKHLVLTMVLRYMNGKDKPYRFVDTHAGAGGYSLEGRYAKKKAEYEQGIARLWERTDLPGPLADYVALVRQFNPQGGLTQYPGSPAFAHLVMRPGDQQRFFELHPTDERILASYAQGQRADPPAPRGQRRTDAGDDLNRRVKSLDLHELEVRPRHRLHASHLVLGVEVQVDRLPVLTWP